MADSRMLPVPDGLEGLRLDVAISRMFGLSRTAAADLIDDGAVFLDGGSPARSEKVKGGAMLRSRFRSRWTWQRRHRVQSMA
jgi:23S rRNA pseudouridine1911/1915/1917 synthase